LYDRLCSPCHGEAGDGAGPAASWLWPRPRDFTRGEFKWRSTVAGQPPTDADLALVIEHGVPGTSMRDFGVALGDAEIAALVAQVKRFAPPGRTGSTVRVGTPVPPVIDDALRARGAAAFASYGCNQCHGAAGAGDGASAASLTDAAGLPDPPYDLRRRPLRRPRAGAGTRADPALAGIYTSLVTGLTGTPMPSYAKLPADDLWAMAAWIDSVRWQGPAFPDQPIDAITQRLDTAGSLAVAGGWTGHGVDGEERIFPTAPLPPQGQPPPSLAPAQASLAARRCGRCHAEQYERWRGSIHAGSVSDGFLAQIVDLGAGSARAAACQKCHAPLAEQRDGQPGFDTELRAEGVSCAGCHLREWRRHGPPRAAGSTLLALPGYPAEASTFYERADFCQPCHQLPARVAVNGRPLLDTYREWLEGPYMRRGVQCQHCHMANRQHAMKGVHDPDSFRQAIDVQAWATRAADGAIEVRARLRNAGAGHSLPTTPAPAAWLVVELVDAAGRALPGASASRRIGRIIEWQGTRFVERADTRVPPGESIELRARLRAAAARGVRVRVQVDPEDFYETFYARKLQRARTDQARERYRRALAHARATRYQALQRAVPIGERR
ncbi:MAG TPA: c-type cytochrome, partial [Kofleriaceae bacterium]|nr:c-type cytochrome [Kofleriaceae bacterium]